jgi:hypothetical protein
MKKFKDVREMCWTGYKRVPGTKPYSKGSCTKEEKLDEMGAGAVGSAGPTVTTGVQTSTDPVSATAVNMKKKKRYPMIGRKT